MQRNDASERQVQAARPDHSTWLSANAGSGKTRVLTDRVARLLLGGTEPQKVLCLTYTKAAATEMQNRLLRRLGSWAMLPDDRLRMELQDLGDDGTITPDRLAEARRLFAKAIETPGGFKIQTIHSFCASLLRRFPLEAGVPHDFTEMDERAGTLLRSDVVEDLAGGADVGAMDALARYFSGEDLDRLLAALSRNSGAFAIPITRDTALAMFDLPPGFDEGTLTAEVFEGGEGGVLSDLVPQLLTSGTNDQKAGVKLGRIDGTNTAALAILEDVLLNGSSAKDPYSAKIGSFPTKALREGKAASLMPELEDLMARVAAARPRRLALAATEKTLALHQFAGAYLPRYAARKAARGWLDFDDLIERAGALLSDPSVAQWVLFRLDGGIDHILVDEAQDTSPGQWAVIERLADEFTAGEGARGITRTIFVVGDRKQSIYSFQGADLHKFSEMQAHFAAKFHDAGRPLQSLDLAHSFRSSDAILRLVDLTFDERVNRGLGGEPQHIAFNADMPGRVDLWPVIPKAEKSDDAPWDQALDQRGESHEVVVLARAIAAEIRRMIDSGVQIPVNGGARPVHEGDFLILVQRRSDLFAEVIRACKAARLAIAGADRLKLGAELAVKDIGSVLAFLATPEDDLALAGALRSPLLGWTEAQLYALAQPRKGYLWEALRDAAPADTMAILNDLRDRADFLRPYELIERLLTRHGGRARLIARLGPEAEDGIDELLSQALAFERAEVPSLTGFLGWLAADDVEVKRQLEGAGRAIRVMTVHGAKGLEAPIVILPDTAKRKAPSGDEIILAGDTALWRTVAAEMPEVMSTLRADEVDRALQERMRLLYVAMTRAEKWLIVCAAGDVGEGPDSWYTLIAAGMEKAGAVALDNAPAAIAAFGTVQRLGHGDWPSNGVAAESATEGTAQLPIWAGQRPPMPVVPEKALSPSDLGGAKALPGEAGLDEDAAKRRGRQLHLLLEHLPGWPEDQWTMIAESLLLTGEDAALSTEIEPVLAEAHRVLTAPEMKSFLAPDALAEVEVVARLEALGGQLIHGTIDRLLVRPDLVRVLDYKSNAVVPARPEDVPTGILRQMAAYHAAMVQIYPDRPIEVAVFWTATGVMMPLSSTRLDAALRTAPVS
ncbi:double-strand break repair helicase AddA [Phaeovulum sp.]|uniref:double-strand break repair helicase AddA n=1 Tax=Phaeovulum sp. TaxID=2934796 RepID=UPI0039E6C1F6